MDTLKQKVIEYGDNRIEYMKEQNQEIADRMTKQVLGMSGVMAQEMKVVSANEYSASEAYTLRKVADKRKDSDEGVLEELHRRLNFY